MSKESQARIQREHSEKLWRELAIPPIRWVFSLSDGSEVELHRTDRGTTIRPLQGGMRAIHLPVGIEPTRSLVERLYALMGDKGE